MNNVNVSYGPEPVKPPPPPLGTPKVYVWGDVSDGIADRDDVWCIVLAHSEEEARALLDQFYGDQKEPQGWRYDGAPDAVLNAPAVIIGQWTSDRWGVG